MQTTQRSLLVNLPADAHRLFAPVGKDAPRPLTRLRPPLLVRYSLGKRTKLWLALRGRLGGNCHSAWRRAGHALGGVGITPFGWNSRLPKRHNRNVRRLD
jgi:hypothetical protein